MPGTSRMVCPASYHIACFLRIPYRFCPAHEARTPRCNSMPAPWAIAHRRGWLFINLDAITPNLEPSFLRSIPGGSLGRGHYPLIRIGQPASRYIARQFMTRSAFDQYQTEASWLIPRLGLDRYPIEVIPPQQIPRRGCALCRCPD